MFTVFLFSAQNGEKSSQTSNCVTQAIIGLTNNETNENTEDLELIIRKLAHYTIYFIGGMLIYKFVDTFKLTNNKKIFYSIIIGATYAVSDEIHQFFIAERSASAFDVMLDTLGIISGVTILLIIKVKRKKKSEVNYGK